MSEKVELGGGRAVVLIDEPDWSEESDPKKVMKWSKTAAKLSKGQLHKVVLLCAHNCIQYLGDNVFVSLPLDTHSEIEYKGRVFKKIACDKDYNKDPAPYEIKKLWGDLFECKCQWSTKMHLDCTHIGELKVEFKRKKFKHAL